MSFFVIFQAFISGYFLYVRILYFDFDADGMHVSVLLYWL